MLLTTVSNYPDALAAASLSEAHDAPLLFTPGDRLDPRVTDAVRDLGTAEVLVLGGPVAVADEVVRDLVAATGVTAVRVAAGDRYGTAALVALEARDPSTVFVVEGAHADPGRGWPDAVSVSSVAARTGHPVLLVTNGAVPDATRQALVELGTRRVIVVGGPVAVSEAVVTELRGLVDEVVRWSGGTRYATSAEVVSRAGLASTGVVVATGLDFRDALVAGPAAGHVGGLSLLVHGGDAAQSSEVLDLLESRHRGADTLVVDTQQAMTDATVETIARAVHG